MLFTNKKNLEEKTKSVMDVFKKKIKIIDEEKLKGEIIDDLVENLQFNKNEEIKKTCEKIIWQVAFQKGIYPASLYSFYQNLAKKKKTNFTIPAINLRGLTYQTSQALIKAAKKNKVGLFIIELAPSEMEYTHQSPEEYAAVILAAAIKQNFSGPLFIQADHFALDRKKYLNNPKLEIKRFKNLISRVIKAGFFNIDLDMSSLVGEGKEDVFTQQKNNFILTAFFTQFIRRQEPKNIEINIGGEVGEIGKKNSTPADLDVFMEGYKKELSRLGVSKGISKIGIQNGVSHGGDVLPGGGMAKSKIDFELLKKLSLMARQKYGLAGAVQHGASTLPLSYFKKFPEFQAIEIHLATDFQNIILDHPAFPSKLQKKIYQWLLQNKKNERKKGWTKAQFIYKIRKMAWGQFKKEITNIDKQAKEKIAKSLEERFNFLFNELKVKNTQKLINNIKN
ncbi:MAG: Fructose-bisphosphate aldolase class-II [Parcubacteria group bacterium ADurb.Bin159]|jgi:fructose/tagatose bisphosphate aldolase|nr:MAG: Fructose-bisphosphate aldolase class-II [Parcubacteria group bacterium ADurb.Bin159]